MIATIISVIVFIVLVVGSIVSALCAAMALRVFIALLKAGPAAADQAYASGASLKKWWRGESWSQTDWSKKI